MTMTILNLENAQMCDYYILRSFIKSIIKIYAIVVMARLVDTGISCTR